MSSLLSEVPTLSVASLLRLLVIFLAAFLITRLWQLMTKKMVKPAESPTRAAQAHEQQARTVAGLLSSVGSKVIWAVAALMAAQEFGIKITAVLVAIAVIGLGMGLGARNLVRDVIGGFSIILEDQYAPGETIQVAETLGRVEHLTLRRTVVRDGRGALVTLANGEIRAVGNLSRDWSQAYVDVGVSPEVPQEQALQALDAVATELRNDPSWSLALVDGPRILGLQNYDQKAATVRVQVRTAAGRHEDVTRELRRRIQREFQKQGIALSSVQRVELVPLAGSQEPRSSA